MQINIFYHMYCVNDCLQRFFRTYKKIEKYGLKDKAQTINTVLVGSQEGIDKCAEEIRGIDKIEIFSFNKDTGGEMNTIKSLQNFCKEKEGAVLYLHSKGVTRGLNENVQAWIDYMEYFLIEKFELCLEKLQSYDTVGVDLHKEPITHYSGNFWWANNSYINTLPPFEECISPNNYFYDRMRYCEFWLLNNKCNPCNLHSAGVDLYGNAYTESHYKL